MATKVLQAMATSAAVDSPVLPSDSIFKTGQQFPVTFNLNLSF